MLRAPLAVLLAVVALGARSSFSLSLSLSPTDTKVRWTGRIRVNNADGSVSWDWEGTQVSVSLGPGATYLSANLSLPVDGLLKLNVDVDGSPSPSPPLPLYPNASGPFLLADGLDPAKAHTVTVFSAAEPSLEQTSPSDPGASPSLLALLSDGPFGLQPAAQSRTIAFLGDGITAGAGAAGTSPCSTSIVTSDASLSYARLVATSLSADLLGQLAWSGKGVYENGGPPPDFVGTLPQLVLQQLGLDPLSLHDFNNPTRPEALVINGGTSDAASGRFANSTFAALFVEAYTELVVSLTQGHLSNGTAVFLAVGGTTDAYAASVVEVVARARALSIPAYLLNVTGTGVDLTGCEGNPSRLGHEQMAAAATPVIAQVMGWPPGGGGAREVAAVPSAVAPLPPPRVRSPSEAAADVARPRATDGEPAAHRLARLRRGRGQGPSTSPAAAAAAAPPPTDITLYVRSDGTGNFSSVQAALDSCNATAANSSSTLGHVTLHLLGTFRERVEVVRGFPNGVTLLGDGAAPTDATVVFNVSGFVSPFGTWGTATVFVRAPDVTFVNVAVVNDAGGFDSKVAGQSVALFLDVTADRFTCLSCALLGAQDTLYTGGAGYGVRSYFFDTYVNGTTDSIFGGSSSVFERNTLDMSYTVTAARGEPASAYLFLDSTVVAARAGEGTLLGRPWGQLTTTIFKGTAMGPGLLPAGWDDWGHECTKPGATAWWCTTVLYAEYNSTGPGADPKGRVGWSRQLSESEAALWNRTGVLRGWEPAQTVASPDAAQWARRAYGEGFGREAVGDWAVRAG
jgi:pectinesterase